jgi:hypothetical protein
MSTADYEHAREGFYPYAFPKTSSDAWFHCRMHNSIYDEIINQFSNPVVTQQFFDVVLLRNSFPEVMEIATFHGLDKLMATKCDYYIELIKEFFATVYFHPDSAFTMTWMSAGR